MTKKSKEKMEAIVNDVRIEMPFFKTGGSKALRVKKALFEKVPALINGVTAQVISDSAILLVAKEAAVAYEFLDSEDDPMIKAFLSFIEKDITENPQNLILADDAYFDDFNDLLEGVSVEG